LKGVVDRLLVKGYPVVAAPNPLRGVHGDAANLANLLDNIPGPVVLVGFRTAAASSRMRPPPWRT
jgi:hypothetical protein